MKILLVTHQFFPDYRAGTEVLTLELAKEYKKRGHEVLIVAGQRNENRPGDITRYSYSGVAVARIDIGKVALSQRLKSHTINHTAEKSFSDLLVKFNPDLVHFNHVIAISTSLILAAKRMGLPVVFTPTDFWTICPTTKLYREWEGNVCADNSDIVACTRCLINKNISKVQLIPAWLIKGYLKLAAILPNNNILLNLENDLLSRKIRMALAINAADIVLAPTKFMRDRLIENGINSKKIKVLPFGVNIGNSYPRTKTAKNGEPLIVGFIGSIVKLKGLHVLLNAYKHLDELSLNVELRIFGDVATSGKYGQSLKVQARQFNSRVQFLGTFNYEKIGSVLEGIDILVIPSTWYENTPLVLCASLASRTPVLVSELGGMTEIVDEGIDGFSFVSGDSQDLANAIKRFIQHPNLARELSTNLARKHIKNSTEYAADVEKEYLELLNKST